MKLYKSLILISLLTLGILIELSAQNQVAIPLSNPGRSGSLELSLVRGSISILGSDENDEVVIQYDGDEITPNNVQPETRNGLRKLTNNAVGFDVTENNNRVRIDGIIPTKDIDLFIIVPKNFSLHLSTVNNGDIDIENVDGEFNLSNVNGDVTLINVGGYATIDTVNGDIVATFESVSDDRPMAFSTVQGDIEVTLPESAKISARMRTERGDIYTDFDINVRRNNQEQVQRNSSTYKVSVNSWIDGDINGGGPDYSFRTLNGDIIIRKE